MEIYARQLCEVCHCYAGLISNVADLNIFECVNCGTRWASCASGQRFYLDIEHWPAWDGPIGLGEMLLFTGRGFGYTWSTTMLIPMTRFRGTRKTGGIRGLEPDFIFIDEATDDLLE